MFNKKERTDEQRFADVDKAVVLLSEEVQKISKNYTALAEEYQALKKQITEYASTLAEHSEKFAELEQQPMAHYTPRPKAMGSDTNFTETDC